MLANPKSALIGSFGRRMLAPAFVQGGEVADRGGHRRMFRSEGFLDDLARPLQQQLGPIVVFFASQNQLSEIVQ